MIGIYDKYNYRNYKGEWKERKDSRKPTSKYENIEIKWAIAEDLQLLERWTVKCQKKQVWGTESLVAESPTVSILTTGHPMA